jgi:hypothetical protein
LKLNSQIKGDDTRRAEEILNSGHDRQLLRLYRDETTLIVLMVRVRNQERREAWEERQATSDLFTTITEIETE